MFVQVIQGPVSDAGQMRSRLERWADELAPGSIGWLGTTAGVTDDGTFVALARFESEEAARQNSDRPEQSAWWEETVSLFSGGAGIPRQHVGRGRHARRSRSGRLRPGHAGTNL